MAGIQSYSEQADTDLVDGLAEHEQPSQPARKPSARAALRRPYGAQPWERGRRVVAPQPRPANREEGSRRHPAEGHPEQAVPGHQPLPGYHDYEDKPVALPHAPLDPGPRNAWYEEGLGHGVRGPHGAPDQPSAKEREMAAMAATRAFEAEEQRTTVDPVPVYVVDPGAGAHPLKRATLRNVPVPAAGGDPVVLVPRNPHQSSVRLLNESSSPLRITFDCSNIGGALLPASMTSYLQIETQEEIYAYQPSGASPAVVSVITQYSVAGGA